MTNDLLKDTLCAYADSAGIPFKVAEGIRNLDWNGEYTDAMTLAKQVQIVGEYNDFNPQVIGKVLLYCGFNAQYRLAREGSPALYIKGWQGSIETLKAIAQADEADVYEGNGTEIRLWWD